MSTHYLGREGWKTVRAAVRGGWGPTLRLLTLLMVTSIPPLVAATVWLRYLD